MLQRMIMVIGRVPMIKERPRGARRRRGWRGEHQDTCWRWHQPWVTGDTDRMYAVWTINSWVNINMNSIIKHSSATEQQFDLIHTQCRWQSERDSEVRDGRLSDSSLPSRQVPMPALLNSSASRILWVMALWTEWTPVCWPRSTLLAGLRCSRVASWSRADTGTLDTHLSAIKQYQ